MSGWRSGSNENYDFSVSELWAEEPTFPASSQTWQALAVAFCPYVSLVSSTLKSCHCPLFPVLQAFRSKMVPHPVPTAGHPHDQTKVMLGKWWMRLVASLPTAYNRGQVWRPFFQLEIGVFI